MVLYCDHDATCQAQCLCPLPPYLSGLGKPPPDSRPRRVDLLRLFQRVDMEAVMQDMSLGADALARLTPAPRQFGTCVSTFTKLGKALHLSPTNTSHRFLGVRLAG